MSRADHIGRWLGRVAAVGCIVCMLAGQPGTPAEVHHIRTGQGGAQRAPDTLTIPLCPEHHRGATGLHADRELFCLMWGSELELLAKTIEQIAKTLHLEDKL
ncbi:MAG: Ref family recombination enhancement nuclease [Aquabacterium sp.]|uniref:Ref family recombination enhancement nuclease n=1 Tax=uncultured Aquabacterium sp. TaxID=158753 RepID=UPI0025E723F8|nr:Ref family recombination enhancement nuclease [uncultured Aquabacterium sp.]